MIGQQRDQPPRPFFNLRGHSACVTALTLCDSEAPPLLVSSDETGSIIIWDLSLYRRKVEFASLVKSKVQSLRIVRLKIENALHRILVVQSRDDGVQLFDLESMISESSAADSNLVTTFPSYSSLFSRGDAIQSTKGETVLAYPAASDRNLVTIRFLEADAKTLASGTAQRREDDPQRSCTVFDLHIKETTGAYHLFAAYEDGCICAYGFDSQSTISVPVLNTTGLKIDLITKIDCQFKDFVSAFDVVLAETGFKIVAGSPTTDLVFSDGTLNSSDCFSEMNQVKLKKRGVSSIAIRPDLKLVAVACWDNSVVLYSLKTRKHLVTLRNHSKQVQSILFITKECLPQQTTADACKELHSQVENNDQPGTYEMCCAAMDGTISITSIY